VSLTTRYSLLAIRQLAAHQHIVSTCGGFGHFSWRNLHDRKTAAKNERNYQP
jgi:hypothetical protein